MLDLMKQPNFSSVNIHNTANLNFKCNRYLFKLCKIDLKNIIT